MLGLIERIAADAVTVIALEDLHWSDRSTRDLLRFLVRNLTQGRVMLIGTYRTDELNERHPFLTLLAELGRSGQVDRFELAPFTRSEVHDQLAGILGRPPDRALVARLHDRGGGNAFFTEELLAVAERGEERIGLTLRETLLARVGGLSAVRPGTSCAWSPWPVNPRGTTSWQRWRGWSRPSIAAALREAIDRHLLLAGDDEVMQFRHGLLREAVYDELLPGERLALHAAVAAAVEALHPDQETDAAVASELAHHWYEARDVRQALPALLRAGRAAERMFAFGNAFAHFHLALSLWPSEMESVDGHDAPGAEDADRRGGRPDRRIRSGDRAGTRALDDDSALEPDADAHRRACSSVSRSITSESGNPDAAQPVALSCARPSARPILLRSREPRCWASWPRRWGCSAISTSPTASPRKRSQRRGRSARPRPRSARWAASAATPPRSEMPPRACEPCARR